jgi:hypothetical protein
MRLRYVLKSTQNSGSPKAVEVIQVYCVRSVSVVLVSINTNVQNGVSIMKDTESGADLPLKNERVSAVQEI